MQHQSCRAAADDTHRLLTALSRLRRRLSLAELCKVLALFVLNGLHHVLLIEGGFGTQLILRLLAATGEENDSREDSPTDKTNCRENRGFHFDEIPVKENRRSA